MALGTDKNPKIEITPETIEAGHDALRDGTNISLAADLSNEIGPYPFGVRL